MDGVAEGPVVGRVQTVGVVEEGRGVLELDSDHLGKAGTHPGLGELIAGFPLATGLPEEVAEERRAGCRRSCGEAEWGVETEVILLKHHGKPPLGPGLIVPGEQNRGAEVDGMTPPFGQDLALDLDPLDPPVVRWYLDRWHGLRELERDSAA